MSERIVQIRLEGDEALIRAAIVVLEHALGDAVQIAPPRKSTRAKYKGSALARGTLRVPTTEAEANLLEQQMQPASSPATGQTRKLRKK